MAAESVRSVPPVDLLVVGGVSSDRLTAASGEMREVAGGAGLYAALGAVAAGARPAIAGIVSDDIPDAFLTGLGEKVDISRLRKIPGRRLHFDIAYDADGRASYRIDDAQAEELITPSTVLPSRPRCRAVHLCPTGSGRTQADVAAALRARDGAAVSLSATTFRGRILAEPEQVRRLVRLLDVLVCSAEDAVLLTGSLDLAGAVRALMPDAVGPGVVCVTDGPRGVRVLRRGHGAAVIQARSAHVVDPTGAGESFAGALAARLTAGSEPTIAAGVAADIAARTVSGWGAESLAAAPGPVAAPAVSFAGGCR